MSSSVAKETEVPSHSSRTVTKRSYDFLFFAKNEEEPQPVVLEPPQDTTSAPPPNAAPVASEKTPESIVKSNAITPRRSTRVRPPRVHLDYGFDNDSARPAKKRRASGSPATVTPTGRSSSKRKGNSKAAAQAKKAKKKQKQPYEPGTLTFLAASMMDIIKTNEHGEIHLDALETQLGLTGGRRRIYDVIHVMEGAGFIEWIPKPGGHRKEGHYRWIGTQKRVSLDGSLAENEEIKALKQEEAELDKWIALLQKQAIDPSDKRLQVNTRYLQQSLFEYERKHHPLADLPAFLAVVMPEGSQLHLPSSMERERRPRPEGFNEHHFFSVLADPNDANTLPEAYILERNEPPRPLSLLPPPPLDQQCCSDFSYNALRHGLFWDIQDEKKEDNTVDMGLIPTLLQAGNSLCWIQS